MKKLLVVLSATLTFAAIADESVNPTNLFGRMTAEEAKKLTPEQRELRKAHFQKLMYERTGGNVIKPGSMKGRIVYVNAQKRAKTEWIQENVNYFTKQTKFTIAIEEGVFKFPKPEVKGEISIFIIDDENLPSLLAAPEDRWAMVNVAPLAKNAKPVFFENRVKKELTRAFSLVAGAMNSSYPGNCVGPITKPEDLDNYADALLAVDVINRFAPYLNKFGVKPFFEAPYIRAVKEGWAPNPTNDVQKKIWNEVHAIPTKPIKIEFDPKRDAGK